MKIKNLSPNPKNPRVIDEDEKGRLHKALLKFGDLSGIVYNRKTKKLVGGHQRTSLMDADTEVTITKKYAKPTKTGTIAEGFVLLEGERFVYREVSWDAQTEKAASIVANNNAGNWNQGQLEEWLKELSSFDVDFDMELTGFSKKELDDMLEVIAPKNTSTEVDMAGFTKMQHTCPKCGFEWSKKNEA